MTKTTPLTTAEKRLFNLITKPRGPKSLALLRVTRKSDGQDAAVIVRVDKDDDDFIITPLAEIIPLEANIHDLYEDPTP